MKKICLKLFSLQKFDKNKSFIQKQPPEGFFKKVFLKNSKKLTWKHLCWSLFLNKVLGLRSITLKKKLQHRCFPVNFVNFVNFFTEHLPAIASFHNSPRSFILQRSFIYLFKSSFVRKIDKNSQFCHIFILQIHFMPYVVNAFYRSKHEHKKSCFVDSGTVFIKVKCRTVIANVK